MINIFIKNTFSNTACFYNLICVNEPLVSIHGVIFTILISIAIYIYGLEDGDNKKAIIDKSGVSNIVKIELISFVVSFLNLSYLVYYFLNFSLIFFVTFKICKAFKSIALFNKNKFSQEKIVTEYKEKIVKETLDRLKDFSELEEKNITIADYFENEHIKRFILSEKINTLTLIRSDRNGYIKNIDTDRLKSIFTEDIGDEENTVQDKKYQYYIPYDIKIGKKIKIGNVLFGTSKNTPNSYLENIKNCIEIVENFDNPEEYFESEIRNYFSELFNLISENNFKILEIKLEQIYKFVDLIIENASLMQFFSEEIIIPLQKYALQKENIDSIKIIVRFSLNYLYKTMDKNLKECFNIFLYNINEIFYESSSYKNKEEVHKILFESLQNDCRYYIFPKLRKNDSDYEEYAYKILSAGNNMLKFSYDMHKKDETESMKTFDAVINYMDESFRKEEHSREDYPLIEEVIKYKKAIIFGFTAWLYKKNIEGTSAFNLKIIENLFNHLKKQDNDKPVDEINYYISIYKKSLELSDIDRFGWGFWDKPGGHVYAITIREDLKILLIDRIINIFKSNLKYPININRDNYNQDISLLKKGSTFDPFLKKDKNDYLSSNKISTENFEEIKEKVYLLFEKISYEYNQDQKINLINKELSLNKFNEFAEKNIKNYKKSRVMYRFKKFSNNHKKIKNGFGYNNILNKDEFVEDSEIIFTNEDEFGYGIARSEDNEIIRRILEKCPKIEEISTKEIIKYISGEDKFDYVVLWTENYFDIESFDKNNLFIPKWKINNGSKNDNQFYQGLINNKEVYSIYRPIEYKEKDNIIILLKKDSFDIEEFIPLIDDDEENVLRYNSEDESIYMTIKDLSKSPKSREKIIEQWIKKESIKRDQKEEKLEELKVSVVFKFFKGIDIPSLKINCDKVKIIKLKEDTAKK